MSQCAVDLQSLSTVLGLLPLPATTPPPPPAATRSACVTGGLIRQIGSVDLLEGLQELRESDQHLLASAFEDPPLTAQQLGDRHSGMWGAAGSKVRGRGGDCRRLWPASVQ